MRIRILVLSRYRYFLGILQIYFLCKVQPFVTLKSDQDQDPHGSALIGSLDPGLDPHWDKKLDPDPHWNRCGFTTQAFGYNFRCLFYDLLPSGAAGQHSADALDAAHRHRLSVGGSVSARRTGAVPAGWSWLAKRGDYHTRKHSSYCSLFQVQPTGQFTS